MSLLSVSIGFLAVSSAFCPSPARSCKSLDAGMSGGSSEDEADDHCVRCGRDDNAHEMLECDSCDAGWHMCLAAATTNPNPNPNPNRQCHADR